MADSERITIRLPADRVRVLQGLVDGGIFGSMSEAIRTAIDIFIEAERTPDNIERVTVEIPKRRAEELEALVLEGESVSIDDAIRIAVSEYTEKRISRALADRR